MNINNLKKVYRAGSRIHLYSQLPQVPSNTEGNVAYVDNNGVLNVVWDNGVDDFEKFSY